MARKRKPFQQKRQPPAPYRRGKQVAFYVPDDLQRAIGDVARARGNISRSELVCSILAAHPDIAAQMELYRVMGDMGTDRGEGKSTPDAGATRESDQEQQGGLWEDMPTLPGPGATSYGGSARKKRGKRDQPETFPFSTGLGPDGERSEGTPTHESDQERTDQRHAASDQGYKLVAVG